MKKIYLSVLSVALVSGLNAQVQHAAPMKRSNDPSKAKPVQTNEAKAITIWSNTFDDANDWDIDHDAADCSLDWQIGSPTCQGSYPIDQSPNDPFSSTTAADGYAMVDSDFYGGSAGGSEVEDSYITTVNPIDLTGYPNVVVEFETYYRRYNSERPFIVIGVGDGAGNVTWPNLDPTTDISSMPNVFDVMPNWGQGVSSAGPNEGNTTSTDNPQVIQVNISSALVGLSAVELTDLYIRFNWTGTWGYSWFVDDINVIEQPADDIQMLNAWVVGSNNEGIEYGRTPSDQIDTDYLVGAEVFNFGINDQDNLVMDADFTSFTSQSTDALLEADSTVYLETSETPSLTVGMYNGVYSVVSDDETSGAFFGNNGYMRNFEITDNVYSTDGIGNHPAGYEDLTSTGSNSFTDAADGLVCANMYHVKVTEEVAALQVMLATGTVEGAEVYGSIKDTANFFANDMTSLFDSDPVVVTAGDIANGYITLNFPGGATLSPGAYFAAVELYSAGNTADIRILDDRTVVQPWYASMIYIPGDQSYSNGDAFAIRMLVNTVGTEELSLEGVSVYPNPSEGLVNVTNANNEEHTITVTDMAGRVIVSTVASQATTLDLSANGTGVYIVKVSNNNGSVVERVVIK